MLHHSVWLALIVMEPGHSGILLFQVGMRLWLKEGSIFKCYGSQWDSIYYSELGSSLAILRAGFNLDCFMMRYTNVDWRDERSWACNARCAHALHVCWLPNVTILA